MSKNKTPCFKGISPSVREALNGHLRGEKKDMTPYKAFLRQTALIQRDAVIWMYESAMNIFKPESVAYTQGLQRLLFLFLNEDQWRADGWPTEQERAFFARACQEVLLHILHCEYTVKGREFRQKWYFFCRHTLKFDLRSIKVPLLVSLKGLIKNPNIPHANS